jgi:hypothetical protein
VNHSPLTHYLRYLSSAKGFPSDKIRKHCVALAPLQDKGAAALPSCDRPGECSTWTHAGSQVLGAPSIGLTLRRGVFGIDRNSCMMDGCNAQFPSLSVLCLPNDLITAKRSRRGVCVEVSAMVRLIRYVVDKIVQLWRLYLHTSMKLGQLTS